MTIPDETALGRRHFPAIAGSLPGVGVDCASGLHHRGVGERRGRASVHASARRCGGTRSARPSTRSTCSTSSPSPRRSCRRLTGDIWPPEWTTTPPSGQNREGFRQWQTRARRLVDVRQVDTSITLMGKKWPTPIIIAPTGSNGAFHPEGEIAVARAARQKQYLQNVLSTVASNGVEDVNAARGEPVWYQLYPFYPWDVTRAVVDRAESAGCPVVVLTVDLQGGSNRVTLKKFTRRDERACDVCHDESRNEPMFDGHELKENDFYRSLDWDFVNRLQAHTSMKLFIKGIVTAADATQAVDHGVDGIVVSNHGGRAEESLRSTIECLPEVVAAVAGRIPVIVDSGFAVVGTSSRAWRWGPMRSPSDARISGDSLRSDSRVSKRCSEMLHQELQIVMRQAGAPDGSPTSRRTSCSVRPR